jgi:hypothetical protein
VPGPPSITPLPRAPQPSSVNNLHTITNCRTPAHAASGAIVDQTETVSSPLASTQSWLSDAGKENIKKWFDGAEHDPMSALRHD